MKRYLIEAEVAGNISDSDFLDRNTRPRKIESLVYTFDGWLGDDLIESVGTYIVTKHLKEAILNSSLSGCNFDKLTLVKSEQFYELYGNKELPEFFWFKVIGEIADDFSILNSSLLVSEEALILLKKFNLNHAEISEFKST